MFNDNFNELLKVSNDLATLLKQQTENLERVTSALGTSISIIECLKNTIKIKDEAHKQLLERYLELVNCGDCGNWNPEKEQEVIESRRVLDYPKE